VQKSEETMTDSTPGRSIGPYELVELIDETGSAMVYRAFQSAMSRYVALKMLKPHVARDAAAVQRFNQQGELMAQMQHPNLLAVYDMGQQEGVVYRVLRFAEGGSLEVHLGAYYNPRAALGLISGITEGLEYIHRQGYVHGNLKPSNVLLDEERRPLLTDFGLAAQSGAPPTPYMSPEQVQGGPVDRRSDVYALGVLLYEMLIGQPPPAGAAISVRALRPDLPERVEPVILKAVAPNPDHRYQSASEFRSALDAALRPTVPPPQPVAAPAPAPAGAPAQQPETKRGPNWLAIILGGGLIVALIVLGLVVASQLGDETTAPEPTATEVPVEETAVPTSPPEPTPPPEPEETPAEPPPEEGETPPEPEQPPDEGEEGGGSPDLPICGSTLFAGGLVLLGGALASGKGRPGVVRARDSVSE
jgi:serine/threonine protein kinase